MQYVIILVLEYGSEVWDLHLKDDIKKLEKVQNRALKIILK